MYKEKFPYKKLKRVEVDGKRRYSLNGSVEDAVPSVTTILDALKDKTHLLEWRKRVGDAEANRIMTTAANIGTIMHDTLEKHILGESVEEKTNLIHQMGRGLADIVIEKGLSNVDEAWGTEVALICPGLYAGTTDCVGVWNGKPAIIDFKTTKRPKKKDWIEDYFMQGAAYATAHNEQFGTDIRTIVIMMIAWDEGHEGEYQEFVIEGDEFDHYQREWLHKVAEYHDKFM